MRRSIPRGPVAPLLAFAFLALLAAPLTAAETSVLLKNLQGTVEVSPGNHGGWIAAQPALALRVGDAVRTGPTGSALLVHGASELFLKPDTAAVVGYQSIQVRQGALWFRMRKSAEGFKFITDVATATIRGTLGLLHTTGEVTTISLLRGKVEVDTVNHENYMLYPQFEAVARRNRRLVTSTMSGTRITDLASEFLGIAKRLGGAPGVGPGGSGGSREDNPGLDERRGDAGEALRKGTGVYDPAALRAAGALTGLDRTGPPPLITVVDNTVNPAIQILGGTASGLVGSVGSTVDNLVAGVGNTAGGLVEGAIGGTTTLIGGVTGGTTTLIGGAIGGTTTLIGGVTGGTTTLIGGVTGGTTTLIGGVTGGTGGLLGGFSR